MKLDDLQKEPELIVLVGLPGVGKSTFIKNKYPNYVVISSDNIIEQLASKEGATYDDVFQKYIGQATAQMKARFREAVENNESIIWDQTNLSKKKRRGILQQIPKHYRTVAVTFNIPDKVRFERMEQRSGKTIPDHVIKSMEKSYQAPTKDEGFDEIIEVRE